MRIFAVFCSLVVCHVACAFVLAVPPAVIEPRIKPEAAPFDPASVKLLDGPFKAAQDRDAQYLLSLSVDRLLARFRTESGLPAKAEGYGGWEAETISGHTLGHYLSACARMFAATGDARFKERTAQIVAELAECQAAVGDGYVAAIPGGHKALEDVRKGNIRSKGFDLNGIWVPWYTLHKQMAGLRDCYVLCGNSQALRVMQGLGDYALLVTAGLDEAQLNTMLRCEHGGMNEVAADLYAITGEEKYLTLARRFNDHQVLDPLSEGKDILPGLHSNTQIPKLIGAARQHELAGDPKLESAATFFWETMTTRHCYVTGGNSLNEYLGQPGILGASLNGNTSETCNTYNMLRLTRMLHAWKPRAAYMDFYERALYNHILASQDPASAGVCYYVPLKPASRKPFQGLEDSFTCCVGTGMENHASYGDAIYSHGDEVLYVNLFIPSSLHWEEKKLTVVQETEFPDGPSTRLTLTCGTPSEFAIRVRHPGWIPGVMDVQVNGQRAIVTTGADGYAVIRRTWKTGDVITIALPAPLRLEPTPDDPTTVALLAGPIVLAGDLGPTMPEPSAIPVIVTDNADVSGWARRQTSPLMEFQTTGVVRPGDVKLVPFFRIASQFYSVYWRRFDQEQWKRQVEQSQQREEQRRQLEAMTTDFVQPGEMQPERDHGFEGDRTNTGEHMGLRWRDAYRGGWFSFLMKAPESGAARLVCTYWGSDTGERMFDILVDDVVVGTQTLDRNRPGEFFDVTYDVPETLIHGKERVRVKFQAREKMFAGGVFGCRILRTP